MIEFAASCGYSSRPAGPEVLTRFEQQPEAMNQTKNTWTQAHDLALVFIALAYGTDEDLSPEELATITDVLQDWRDDFPVDEVQDVVMEAVAVYTGDSSDEEVQQSIEALRDQLSVDERRRALEHLSMVAEADGVLLRAEQSLLTRLADAWEIKSGTTTKLDALQSGEADPQTWSLLDRIALMYIVLAHSTDSHLEEAEIEAMVRRLNDWEPELSEEDVRTVLRKALAYYSEQPEEAELRASIDTLRKRLPAMYRLVLLDDLASIARADGELNAQEREMIANLSSAWGVDIRLNGTVDL